MRKPTVLFVTYAQQEPFSLIGVLKRCFRLVAELPGHWRIHVHNFGHLPWRDPLIEQVRPRISYSEGPAATEAFASGALLRAVRPDVVVIGESPLEGRLLQAYRICAAARIPQICIENYYGEVMRFHIALSYRYIRRWLLIGLREPGTLERPIPRAEVVAPLVALPERPSFFRDSGVCILGYDEKTLRVGLSLAIRLPEGVPATVLIRPGLEGIAAAARQRRKGLEIRPIPSDCDLFRLMAEARIVVCKNGFQQMTEAVGLGTPVIACPQTGGVPSELLPPHLASFIRYVTEEGVAEAVPVAFHWLSRRPASPWSAEPLWGRDLRKRAAERLTTLIQDLHGGEAVSAGPGLRCAPVTALGRLC